MSQHPLPPPHSNRHSNSTLLTQRVWEESVFLLKQLMQLKEKHPFSVTQHFPHLVSPHYIYHGTKEEAAEPCSRSRSPTPSPSPRLTLFGQLNPLLAQVSQQR